jgi:hypothetical protein
MSALQAAERIAKAAEAEKKASEVYTVYVHYTYPIRIMHIQHELQRTT